MKRSSHIGAASAIGLLMPALAFAQAKTLATVIDQVLGYLNQALYLLMGVATVVFVFYVVKYYVRPNENRAEAGSYVLYSVVGFFVILSFWGIVNILRNTFGLQSTSPSWTEIRGIFPGGSSSGSLTNSSRSVVVPSSGGADYSGSYYVPYDNNPTESEQ